MMDYSGYYEFPFPAQISEQEALLKNFFFSLPDERQLALLNGCASYHAFCDRLRAAANPS